MNWVLENIKGFLLILVGVIMALWFFKKPLLVKLTEVFMSEIAW